jgi:hypothetical protein
MPISELCDDELWHVLSTVRSPDLSAQDIQMRGSQRDGVVYDPQLVTLVIDLQVLWSVCKRWKNVMYGVFTPKKRRVINDLISHRSDVVMTAARRYGRAVQLHAALPHLRYLENPDGLFKRLMQSSSCVIFSRKIQSAVYSMLCRAAAYSWQRECLHRVVSDSVYYSVLSAFEKSVGREERLDQVRCYVWCSSRKPCPGADSMLMLDGSLKIARRLRKHPLLCKLVLFMSQIAPVPVDPALTKQLQHGSLVASRGRRVLPMTFGLPEG